jgi:hypothetical protein
LQYDGSHYFLKVGGVATTGGTSFPVYIAGSVTANPTGTQTIAGTVTANVPLVSTDLSGGVTQGIPVYLAGGKDGVVLDEINYVNNVLSLPAISGVVTANGGDFASGDANPPFKAVQLGYFDEFVSNNFVRVTPDKPFPVQVLSGTVTANPTGTQTIAGTVTANPTGTQTIAGSVTLGAGTAQIGSVTASISGTVPISISSVTVGNSVTIGSLPAISGTVTANSSNGSLTTRFGSVTTANTAFATSAVTNANRKYLLIQNVTTASNAITVGIGFTPTTTQGIQLSSGAGLTFEGSYIPTGAVNLLSSVTASCFTILEA